jgi:hypothetical protein
MVEGRRAKPAPSPLDNISAEMFNTFRRGAQAIETQTVFRVLCTHNIQDSYDQTAPTQRTSGKILRCWHSSCATPQNQPLWIADQDQPDPAVGPLSAEGTV